MDQKKWEFVDKSSATVAEDTRPSLTYWKDVWNRFKGNKMALLGLVLLLVIVLTVIIGPMTTTITYSDQKLEYGNITPMLELLDIGDGDYIFVHKEFKLIQVSEKGDILGIPEMTENDMMNRVKSFDVNGKKVTIDYKKAAQKDLPKGALNYDLTVNGEPIDASKTISKWNKTYLLGTDKLGRDVWIRVLYGGRTSLMVGVVAAFFNAIIGVFYGGVAGYYGGRVDNVMMRIVDFINSIPLMLIVILIGVFVNNTGATTIILTIGLVYWVSMARQVRGQVMSLKEQEFVLAARTLGASSKRIITRHMIPNALGPIVVSMMMSIPSAMFTEAFLSFVGLGVSAPKASWGTLANDALGGIRSFPYLLIAPSVAIALTMFALNFVGDGLRDALDPQQRQ